MPFKLSTINLKYFYKNPISKNQLYSTAYNLQLCKNLSQNKKFSINPKDLPKKPTYTINDYRPLETHNQIKKTLEMYKKADELREKFARSDCKNK